jgi:transcriptional regulator GlxA family with amidase domain
MIAYPDAQILDITGPLEVFSRASRWLMDHGYQSGPSYEVQLCGLEPGAVRCSSGLELNTTRTYRELGAVDTLLVSGGIGFHHATTHAEFLQWLKDRTRCVERLGSICTGAFVLAAAGLLQKRQATTHWAYCCKLTAFTPGTEVKPDAIYVRDGHIYTSAGVTAGMDLALAMVEEDWGRKVALAVAKELVLYLKRPGGQSQFSPQLAAQTLESDWLGDLQLWVLEHPEADLSVDRLAERVNMSPRHFARRFTEETGVTPAKFVEQVRVDAARRKLEETNMPIDVTARRCGFTGAEQMRRAFVRHLGVSPSEYRHCFNCVTDEPKEPATRATPPKTAPAAARTIPGMTFPKRGTEKTRTPGPITTKSEEGREPL